jgi:predicted peptidase
LPATVAIPTSGLGEGDFVVEFSIAAQGKQLAEAEYRFSLAHKLSSRVAALEMATAGFEQAKENIDRQTAFAQTKLLRALARGDVLETDYPAARLLAEAENAAAAATNEPYYNGKRPGQFWLTIGTERANLPVRIYVPDAAATDRPVPLVVALHGAGGSENLFFDGYGAGAIVDECKERRWLLVSPRTAGFGLLPVDELVAALAKIYPVEKDRVFIVGHSMGAMQATAAALAHPECYAAIAALGGGGAAKANAGLARLAYFVAGGSEDFALSGARRLEKSLRNAGVEKVIFREYPDVEHLLVVQEALPEVFRFFDDISAKGR